MPGMMFIPPQQSPLEDFSRNMGNLITQLALMKISQNFREKEAVVESAREDIRLQKQQQAAERLKGIGGVISGTLEEIPAEARPGEEKIANAVNLGGRTFRIKEQAKPVEVNIAGKKFAWIPGTDKLVLAEGKEERPTGKTIYGPSGQSKQVWIKPGEEYVPPQGWTLETPAKPFFMPVQTGEGFGQVNTRSPGGEISPVKEPGGGRAGARINPNEIEELTGMKTTYERLEEVSGKLEKMKDKIGPLAGRFEKLKTMFVNNPTSQDVINELESMITIAYNLSGKQVSYNEMQMLKAAILPRLEQPDANIFSTIKQAQAWLARTHDNKLNGLKSSGYSTKMEPIGFEKTKDPLGIR